MQHLFQSKWTAFAKVYHCVLCLIFWAHCDALNQSLDGSAGRHLKRDFVDFQEAECESSQWPVTLSKQKPTNSEKFIII